MGESSGGWRVLKLENAEDREYQNCTIVEFLKQGWRMQQRKRSEAHRSWEEARSWITQKFKKEGVKGVCFYEHRYIHRFINQIRFGSGRVGFQPKPSLVYWWMYDLPRYVTQVSSGLLCVPKRS